MEQGDSPGPQENEDQKAQPKSRVFTRYPLPSDRHPFSAHFEILRRFVTYGRTQPVSADRVEGEGIPVQAASMNVRFMASVGLLKFESKGLYSPTTETTRFVNAKTVSDERARPIMKSINAPSWFSQAAADLLRAQPIVTEDQLVGELALASETDKSKKEPALRILVDYLVYSGIVTRGDKGFTLGEAQPLADVAGPSSSRNDESTFLQSGLTGRIDVLRSASGTDSKDWLVVQTEDFYLKVRATPAALEYVEDQLTLLRKRVSRLSPPDSSPSS